MSVIYSCHCLNIRIHLATKYNLNNLEKHKQENSVKNPLFGWEFELGIGGLNNEFSFLTQSKNIIPEWTTVRCLNCNSNDIYSSTTTLSNRVIVHESAIYGKQYEELKQKADYSSTFNINLSPTDNYIPMPSSLEDIPEQLISTHKQIKSILNQSIEQLRQESRIKIENFKKEQEKQLQEQISHAKLENNLLWTKLMEISSIPEPKQQQKQEEEQNQSASHVRFALEDNNTSKKRLSFALDESTISNLRNVNLNHLSNVISSNEDDEDSNEDEEEEMFNLDEELSEEESTPVLEEDNEDIEEDTPALDHKKNDLLLSASLKKSISEIDQRFSWVKKKRNTNKYLVNDFDIKTDTATKETNDNKKPVSLFATSVPITIHYSLADDQDTKVEPNTEQTSNKRDILATSFANYDSSFSDRQLSSQFSSITATTTRDFRRKSLASSSLIRPQLESLTGQSLDTRGLLKKKLNQIDLHDSDEEFDSSVPPHIWAAKNSMDEI